MTSTADVLVARWKQELDNSAATNAYDDPSFESGDLVTTSSVGTFALGTGEQLLQSIFPVLGAAQSEILFVTCFWAESASRTAFASCLSDLSTRALREGRKVKVRICFSSCSLLQKLFQTSSLNGKGYPSTKWTKLGLPHPSELAGLDLHVKSVFVRPFSVMHTKFIVIDRKILFVPSFNVSFENWFEGVIETQGPLVERYLDLYKRFWAREELFTLPNTAETDVQEDSNTHLELFASNLAEILGSSTLDLTEVPAIFLPSPHHANPRFRPMCLKAPSPPPTPLNIFFIQALANAKRTIYLQTPNLTAPPIIEGLLDALKRGIDIRILTNNKMMFLEQLGTAGTWTELSIRRLLRKYHKIQEQYSKAPISAAERGISQPGRLLIEYYKPSTSSRHLQEPVKSHLKLTIIDEEIVVLGSGNQDRASYFTSQEVGVAFNSKSMAHSIWTTVDKALNGRRQQIT